MNIIDELANARNAGKTACLNGKPQPATIYRFCAMHMRGTANPEREFAEALDRGDKFEKNYIASDYISAWLEANNILWGGFHIENMTKHDHGHDDGDSYHYCFTAIVFPRTEW